jgi:hypothetical protein
MAKNTNKIYYICIIAMVIGMAIIVNGLVRYYQAPSNEVKDSVSNASIIVKKVTHEQHGNARYITFKNLGDNAETTDAVLSFTGSAYLSSDGGKTGKKITTPDGATFTLNFSKAGFSITGTRGSASYRYHYQYDDDKDSLEKIG